MMRVRDSIAALGLGVALATGGCSTILRGPSQKMTFETDVPGSVVYVGTKTVTAPATVKLSRKKTYAVLITAPGRESVQFTLKPHFDGASLGNLIYPGGSIGLITDYLTGADKTFNKLKKIQMPELAEKRGAGAPPALVYLREKGGKLVLPQDVVAEKEAAKPAAGETEGAEEGKRALGG